MKEGWKVLKFHETIIELQSKEPWKMDLNGNSDYKLHRRLVGQNASCDFGKTAETWRMRMSHREHWLDSDCLLFSVVLMFVHRYPCVCKCLGRYTCVSELARKYSFLLMALFNTPPGAESRLWVLRQLSLSFSCFLVWRSLWLSENWDHVLCSSLPTGINKVRYNDLWSEVKVLVAQSRPTFCNPVDCNLPVSSVHGIL